MTKHRQMIALSSLAVAALASSLAAAGVACCEMPSGCPMKEMVTSSSHCQGEGIMTSDCCSLEQVPAVPGRAVEAIPAASLPALGSEAGVQVAVARDLEDLLSRADRLAGHSRLPLYTLFTTLLI